MRSRRQAIKRAQETQLAEAPETAAKVREGTRQKRLAQMLEELERGDKYMKMDYGA